MTSRIFLNNYVNITPEAFDRKKYTTQNGAEYSKALNFSEGVFGLDLT